MCGTECRQYQAALVRRLSHKKARGKHIMEDIELRRLVIRAFHMDSVEFGDENLITTDGKMTIKKE